MSLFAPVAINFLGLKINSIDNGSLFNLGANQFIDHFVSYKRNQGFGEQNGDISPIIIPICSVYDPDVSDSWSGKFSIV